MAMSRSRAAMSLTTPVADPHLAAADALKPGDHPQKRGLAAARGADKDHEFAIADVDRDALDDMGGTARFMHLLDGNGVISGPPDV